ncbi:hypothetical protein [Rhizobium sp. MHM7A]|uniref:hypothetical protein n=1 Tax=Rhizobium sp. MHM7A TaxID=2583233 RepID=UPI00110602E1|nr:hypothetical protein [Rhizobium sp. MHM7A]TLX16319.1 hypothetical protein FFR93_03035 [Rhizobium sp. MHM7A]
MHLQRTLRIVLGFSAMLSFTLDGDHAFSQSRPLLPFNPTSDECADFTKEYDAYLGQLRASHEKCMRANTFEPYNTYAETCPGRLQVPRQCVSVQTQYSCAIAAFGAEVNDCYSRVHVDEDDPKNIIRDNLFERTFHLNDRDAWLQTPAFVGDYENLRTSLNESNPPNERILSALSLLSSPLLGDGALAEFQQEQLELAAKTTSDIQQSQLNKIIEEISAIGTSSDTVPTDQPSGPEETIASVAKLTSDIAAANNAKAKKDQPRINTTAPTKAHACPKGTSWSLRIGPSSRLEWNCFCPPGTQFDSIDFYNGRTTSFCQ